MRGGTVTVASWEGWGYGNYVVVDHGTIEGRNYKTLYAHMSEVYVSPGQYVQQGESIGRMGSTGLSTGTHLHFEVIVDGVKVNPLNYLN
jgi:murein DD-endopeptidase MepM/ murein hydrolase activator NlpD